MNHREALYLAPPLQTGRESAKIRSVSPQLRCLPSLWLLLKLEFRELKLAGPVLPPPTLAAGPDGPISSPPPNPKNDPVVVVDALSAVWCPLGVKVKLCVSLRLPADTMKICTTTGSQMSWLMYGGTVQMR